MKAPASRGSSAIIGEPWETKSGRACVFMPSLEHRAPPRRFKRLLHGQIQAASAGRRARHLSYRVAP